jgi:hypothetical protein
MMRLTGFSTVLVLAAAIWLGWPRPGTALSSGKAAPELAGVNWINSRPLSIAGLKGRVVLLEFWTYG